MDEISGRPLKLESLRALAANSLTNEAPLRALHSGFRGRPPQHFLAARDTHTPKERPDFRVHVLGPLEDRNVIHDMDLPTTQAYLRHLEAATATAEPVSCQRRSFARHFTIPPADYEDGKLSPVAPDETKEIARTVMGDDDLATVASLDKTISSTSLIPKFESGGAFLIPLGTPTRHLGYQRTSGSGPPAPRCTQCGRGRRSDATRLAKLRRRAKRVILSYHADAVKRHTGAARYRDKSQIPLLKEARHGQTETQQ